MSTNLIHVQVARKAARRNVTAQSGGTRVQSAIVAESEALNDCALTLPMARTERDATTCAIAGCWHLVASRTWCNKHYQRWVKWGDPLRTLNPQPRGAAR